MTDQHHSDVVVLLAGDALEASGDQAADATFMLVDAALAIIITRQSGANARILSDLLAQYVIVQVAAVTNVEGAA